MINMSIDLKTSPQKQAEFLQNLDQLLLDLRREEGNVEYEYRQSDKDSTEIHLQARWKTWENLERHLRGEFFAILMGSIRVLCEKPVVNIDDGLKNIEPDEKDKKWQ